MIVCNCNALSDAAIRAACQAGPGTVSEVYARCGCQAKCGSCTAAILGFLREGPPPRG